jgi:hypothetical protein
MPGKPGQWTPPTPPAAIPWPAPATKPLAFKVTATVGSSKSRIVAGANRSDVT